MICNLRRLFFAINIFLLISGCLLFGLVLIADSYREGKDSSSLVFILCLFGAVSLLDPPFGIVGAYKKDERFMKAYAFFMPTGGAVLLPFLILWFPEQKQTTDVPEGVKLAFQLAIGLSITMLAIEVIGMIMSVPLYCKYKKQNAARRTSSEGNNNQSTCDGIIDVATCLLPCFC
ncbi:hypothetical protein AGOR_G00249770 [Albula goreensis]|uniref:Uncharacterized protein n=1 Tax=Albula goreensis TaxID=1534307 RepID=A0A8T3CBK5_9TELE|nr:hypothetical protein AGOR_G00249770 [Albula goreensis]